ncbi:hypothetical protein BDV12DRAFT_187217 [Aspergillus spectabilis]
MHAALIKSWTCPSPTYTLIPNPPTRPPTHLQLKILAVGIPRVVRLRAQGKHPTAKSASLPYDPSIDGVGIDEESERMYYILPLSAALLAEYVNVERSQLVPLGPGCDPVEIAGMVNPVSSSWMALRRRATGDVQGKTVLVIGATSKSGRAAVAVARFLGARRVVGVARVEAGLRGVEGLDGWVISSNMSSDGKSGARSGKGFGLPDWVGPVHVVLDYVGGSVAVGVLESAEIEDGEELQYIQVGNLATEQGNGGGEKHMFETLPGHLISRKPISIRGSGMGSFSRDDLRGEMPALMAFLAEMKAPFGIVSAPMSEVESAWDTEDTEGSRLVIVPA